MYRQRKRDLNLKPNRQLDKRSSRGMIYENEELRMRTIAICEDVDRGQSDIKKLRKENEHLKREIWGLRDECEKLEEILKKVCISANIPDFDLDVSKKNREEEDSDDDEDDDDEEYDEDASSYGGSDQHLKIDGGGRQRKESCVSVLTIDSEVGNCMTTMFGDDPGGGCGGGASGGQESGFAVEDPGSAIMNPECSTSASAMIQSAEVICHPYPSTTTATEPVPSTSFAQQQQMSWSHPTAVPPDLECVKEETDSAISSPIQMEQQLQSCLEPLILPDPNLITFPPEVMGASAPPQQDVLYPADGRKTPVIQITPASSPASNGNGTDSVQSEPQSPTDNIPLDSEPVHSIGCITVVPKTFKVTSEIVVGDEGSGERSLEQFQSKSEELPRKILKLPPQKQDSDPISSDHIVLNQYSLHGPHYPQRRSCYFPSTATTTASSTAQTLPASSHRSFGMLPGYSCCCSVGDEHLVGGYQSEPSLNHAAVLSSTSEEFPSILNPFQCCRVPPVAASPMTLRSVWNTVDKNIVIGFYGISGGGGGGDTSIEPKVQEIIDELENQFDPTLENIQGIRLIPGRIFISVKNATLVQSFLTHFKNDLVLTRKNTQQRIRIHFIEGCSQKVTTTLVLSGIPPELSDLAVISSLNQFGQVVAPLERRNYKGVDISERIAKMHLVIGEGSLPECINVNGYNVRIKREQQDLHVQLVGVETSVAPKYYGFVPPNQNQTVTSTIAIGTTAATSASPTTLKPHKPVIQSSSSAPRLETPAPGTLISPFPTVEQKRQSSVCVGNIPMDQHPSKVMEKQQGQSPPQHKVTIAQQSLNQSHQSMQGSSTPNLQPPPKKPLARLLVSSPGSFTASPPVSSPVSPVGGAETAGQSGGGGALKAFYRSFDPRRASSTQGGGTSSIGTHAPLTPSSSYSPRTRRKSSVQFAGRGGKREPLPWCGCWGLGCGN